MNERRPSAPERVLLLAPTGRDATLACAALHAAGIDVETCRDLAEAVVELADGAEALVIAQEAIDARGTRLLAEWTARQPAWSDLPVIVFSSASSALDPAVVLGRLAGFGNVLLLERPLRRTTFVTVVRSAIRARRRQYAARDVLVALEHEVAARDQFLAMLGHELRNPLSAITMALHVMERLVPSGSREFGIVARQSRQLARIVDNLLDVARVTSGKIVLHRALVDLSALVVRALEALQPQAARAGIALLPTVARGLMVDGDAVRLEQVLVNIVGNALKYTPSGGHVWVVLERDAAEAVLRVRDDGAGIAPDQLRRVFETFAQVHSTIDRSHGGLGLGLTVARSLVAMHGGTIEASSEGVGKGSEFIVRLPLSAGSDDAEAGEPAKRIEVQRARRILVIEDGEDNRVALKAVLEQLGHEVLDSADGLTGAEHAIQDAPEVVLVDIGLPGLDGYEVARRIRAARGRGVLLVALTGYGQPEDRRSALAAGFDAHLTKPVELETLAAVIARHG